MASILEGGFLAGKKTYITAVLMILTAVANYLTGDAGLSDTINQVLLAFGMGFLRAGVAKTG